jgi:hypothetical protein
MKDDQITLRLPHSLAGEIARQARERGVPRSQLVREALQAYLADGVPADPDASWRRVAPLVGTLALDPASVERDAIASQVRAHNWRE